MVETGFSQLRSGFLYFLLLGFNIFLNTACAVDNPEAIDFIGPFENREKHHIAAINNPNNGNRDYLIAYDKYLQFLDKELNDAFQQVKSKLPENQKNQLIQSQRNWLKYRDAEFMLIKNTWTRQNYGSSAGISRGDYKSEIIKKRIDQLLVYLLSL